MDLGNFIREIEWIINMQVNGTKELALRSVNLYLEPGGSL